MKLVLLKYNNRRKKQSSVCLKGFFVYNFNLINPNCVSVKHSHKSKLNNNIINDIDQSNI